MTAQQRSRRAHQSASASVIHVIGLSAAGRDALSGESLARITQAELLVGGRRHLAYFPEFEGETLPITRDVDRVVERLQQALAQNQRAVVLASGDPLWYGIGGTLLRFLPPEALHMTAAPTAFQHAFSALREPWQDAALLSAHARPLDAVIAGVLGAPKAAILTDNEQTPPVIAQALMKAGLALSTPCAVCENLGAPEERIVRSTLGELTAHSFAPLNVLIVWNSEEEGAATGTSVSALEDDDFATSRNQITKREIRLLALAELALGPAQILWDIGAGSGAVSIEAARRDPHARVYAVERRTEFCRHIDANVRRHNVRNVLLVRGEAPAVCDVLPDPDAIFVGGSGGRLAEILAAATGRLRRHGRLVLNLATLENLESVRRTLPDARINQIQINRGRPIQKMLRFEALNPIYMVTWQRT